MSEEDPSTPLEMGVGRIEAFSDAVMAVIMTIMAFQLRVPEGHSFSALADTLPGLSVYVLSFALIAIYWNNHHHLLRVATRISGAVMWANMFLLFCLSLVPVATGWVRDEGTHHLPAAVFGIVSFAAGFAYSLLVRALIRANGPDSPVARAIAGDMKGYASVGIYAAGVGMAFVNPWIAYALYVSVAIMWLIPDRRFTRI